MLAQCHVEKCMPRLRRFDLVDGKDGYGPWNRLLLLSSGIALCLSAGNADAKSPPPPTAFYWLPVLLDGGLSYHDGTGTAFTWVPYLGLGVGSIYDPWLSAKALQEAVALKARMDVSKGTGPLTADETRRTVEELDRLHESLQSADDAVGRWPVRWYAGVRLGGFFTNADLRTGDGAKFPGAYGPALGVEFFWNRFGLSADYLRPTRNGERRVEDCHPSGRGYDTCMVDSETTSIAGNGFEAALTVGVWRFEMFRGMLGILELRAYGGQIAYPGDASEMFGGINAVIRPVKF
jgi:hypothetical protein